MYRVITFFVAMTLAILGTLVFMAKNQLGLLSGQATTLIGTGLFMFSGLGWCLYGMTFKEPKSGDSR